MSFVSRHKNKFANGAIILGIIMITYFACSGLFLEFESDVLKGISGSSITIGLIVLISGIVASKINRLVIGGIFGGTAVLLMGSYLTYQLIVGDITGSFVVGFIPIPMIIVVPLVPLAGIGLIVIGVLKAFKKIDW